MSLLSRQGMKLICITKSHNSGFFVAILKRKVRIVKHKLVIARYKLKINSQNYPFLFHDRNKLEFSLQLQVYNLFSLFSQNEFTSQFWVYIFQDWGKNRNYKIYIHDYLFIPLWKHAWLFPLKYEFITCNSDFFLKCISSYQFLVYTLKFWVN